ncbi:XdhC family protein [Edaphobacter dinghuensis]|uniref:Xanthine dehydrogenase n=1 Tax=Edaphobacter dinghuensis TaxID=1560005 RepID=A0A917M2H2_9BACT|nr:XdhC/CoxI family protein [Edaphobacter dinghuensis]GGG70804.1 xanthine dehydrogenase [Edaphobacter dinghuensis]
MRERRQIVRLWRQGNAAVLVTLVRVAGSSYRQVGARLLLDTKGKYAGTISGGCLETELTRKAAWMVRDGATVERYSTAFDDTEEIPFGLGCGGIVDLLVEPAESLECRALMEAMEDSLRGNEATVVTWLPGEGKELRRVIFGSDGGVVFASAGLDQETINSARGLLAGGRYEGRFVEELRAPQRLFMLGAGDDARPLVSMASLLGWSVIVADGRAQLARAERFAEAERVVTLGEAGASELGIRRSDAVVLMTHSYEQDREILASLLPMAPGYVGLLGARHRSSLLVSEAASRLGWTVAECCELIHAPVGLDLGGEGPEAIALAVIAEVQAYCQGKIGISRRLTAESIARQIELGGASRYLQMQCAMEQ